MMKIRYLSIICLGVIISALLTGCGGSTLSYIENEIDRSYSNNSLDRILKDIDRAFDPLKGELDYIYGEIESAYR